jgi:hypothetical protein|tara:strand:+ start:531 stop:719 length:189 start_codon:yes stop_codon:yes gene_type:complete
MKEIRHSKLPITIVSSDNLTTDLLKAISLNMEYDMWDAWIGEDGNWFNPFKTNKNQLELFND